MTLYGISEIAEALGVPVGTVKSWNARGKLPPPDWTPKAGPMWSGETIGPWVRSKRKEA